MLASEPVGVASYTTSGEGGSVHAGRGGASPLLSGPRLQGAAESRRGGGREGGAAEEEG